MQWRRYIWGIGARALLEFWKLCAFCSGCQLNCKHFENYQRRQCNVFSSISPEHDKTHVSKLKQSRNPKEIPGTGGEEKFMFCPLASFPGDTTAALLFLWIGPLRMSL